MGTCPLENTMEEFFAPKSEYEILEEIIYVLK